jgi:hypothetical protein
MYSSNLFAGTPRCAQASSGGVHVVGDAEDVEPLLAVEVNEGGEREASVAPRRVGVEFG